MAPDLRTLAVQGKTLWGKLPRRHQAMIVGALALTIIGLLVLTRTAEPRYTVLYAGLSPEDAGEVVAALEARGIPHRAEAGGTAIAVPQDKVLGLRLDLAEKGLPRGGGVGFEVFDKQAFGTTSFVEQMNFRRALQGELSRTITSLDAVDGARVHLALGERSLYKADDEPPAASVVLRLRQGRTLSPGQVRGVVHLVSSSVDGLTPSRVTVVDERGEVLSSSDDEERGAAGQRDLERTLTRRVQDMVERIVGAGHAVVTVTAELDHSQVAMTEETFGDTPVPRSESLIEERTPGTAGAGGVTGARANLPGAPAPSGGPNDPGLVRLEQSKNYEISKTVRNTTGPAGRVVRLHVAVLVDATTGADGARAVRTTEELAQIEALARDAAGLDATRGDRISVRSAVFSADAADEMIAAPTAEPALALPGDVPVWMAAAGGGGLLFLIGVVLMVMRRGRRKHATRTGPELLSGMPVTVGQLEASLEPSASLSALALPGRDVRERALEAARGDADRAARVISLWLADPAAPSAAHVTGGS